MLDKSAISKARTLRTAEITVPEWGGTVRVQVLSGKAREIIMDAYFNAKDQGTSRQTQVMQRELLRLCIVDEAGAPMFTQEEIDALMANNAADLIERVAREISVVNKLLPEQVEEAAKNS